MGFGNKCATGGFVACVCFGIMWLLVKKIKLMLFSESLVCFMKVYQNILI